jgi:hypothetical protein
MEIVGGSRVVRVVLLRSCSYMFRPDESKVEWAPCIRSQTVRRTGPGSLIKTRLQRGGTTRPYTGSQLQGQPLPGRLKPGALYQCLTICLFLGIIRLVRPARLSFPSSNPCRWLTASDAIGCQARGSASTPCWYLTLAWLDTAFGPRRTSAWSPGWPGIRGKDPPKEAVD